MTTENTKPDSTIKKISPPSFTKCMPAVQSEFRRNEFIFEGKKPQPGIWDEPCLPLTAVRGPHSDRISSALLKHPNLKRFAEGVDERSVYSVTHLVGGTGCVDWDVDNNSKPLVFTFYDNTRDTYEVSCLEIDEAYTARWGHEYCMKIYALIDLYDDHNDPKFADHFVEINRPLELTYRPDASTAETDINRLMCSDFYTIAEFVSRLGFLTEVLGDPMTQQCPF